MLVSASASAFIYAFWRVDKEKQATPRLHVVRSCYFPGECGTKARNQRSLA